MKCETCDCEIKRNNRCGDGCPIDDLYNRLNEEKQVPTVVIMRGIPGSGKSTYVEKNFPTYTKVSADSFFTNSEGEYVFSPALLGRAHGQCLIDFHRALEVGRNVVVDNTNITEIEMAPYIAWALANQYHLRIIRLKCDYMMASARCTHGVPWETIKNMNKRINTTLPPFWPQEEVIEATEDAPF